MIILKLIAAFTVGTLTLVPQINPFFGKCLNVPTNAWLRPRCTEFCVKLMLFSKGPLNSGIHCVFDNFILPKSFM